MKNLIFTLILVLSNLVVNSQSPAYFYPQFEAMYVLDSLNIPYLPIPERNGKSPVGMTYSTQEGVKLHNKFFKNNEFDFSPSESTPSVPFMSFVGSYVFLTEDDKFAVNMFSNWDWDVIGFSKIKLKEGKYKSVEIIEYHSNSNDTYGTIVILETNMGYKTFVNSVTHPVSLDWSPSFK